MNKEALIFNNHSPLEVLLGSAMMGGGGFAALRLLKEVMSQKQQEAGKNEDSLVIDLPKDMNPQQHQQQVKTANEDLQKALAVLLGVPGGFMGTKYLYDKYKHHQLQQQIEGANQDYMRSLSGFNKPAGDNSATPYVDAFCEKLAEEGTLKRIAEGVGGIFGMGGPTHDARVNLASGITQPRAIGQGVNLATAGNKDLLAQTLAATALLTGGLGFAGMAMAHKNREQSEKSRQFPSAVELNYA